MFVKLEICKNFLKNLIFLLNFTYFYDSNFEKRSNAQTLKRSISFFSFLTFFCSNILTAQTEGNQFLMGVIDKPFDDNKNANGVSVKITSGNSFFSDITSPHSSFPLLPSTTSANVWLNTDGVYYAALPKVPYSIPVVSTPVSMILSRNYDLTNGVSTIDIVTMQQHILGITKFTKFWQNIEADVNASGTVSTADIVAIRKAILYGTPFPATESWIFADTSPFFSYDSASGKYYLNQLGQQYTTNPASISGYPWSIMYDGAHPYKTKLNGPGVTFKAFNGFKMGHCDLDPNSKRPQTRQVNNSSSNLVQLAENRESSLYFLEDKSIKKGQIFTLDISISPNGEKLNGFQFTIKPNSKLIDLMSTQNADIKGFISDNIGINDYENEGIRVLWTSKDGNVEQIENKNRLFSITFKANKDIANIADIIELNESVIPTEFVNENAHYTKGLIQIELKNLNTFESKVYPTNFSDRLTIDLGTLSKAENIDFNLYRVDGTLAFSKVMSIEEGNNSNVVEGLESLTKGAYYYVIKSSNGAIKSSGLLTK